MGAAAMDRTGWTAAAEGRRRRYSRRIRDVTEEEKVSMDDDILLKPSSTYTQAVF